jgi:hypothetical protein
LVLTAAAAAAATTLRDKIGSTSKRKKGSVEREKECLSDLFGQT